MRFSAERGRGARSWRCVALDRVPDPHEIGSRGEYNLPSTLEVSRQTIEVAITSLAVFLEEGLEILDGADPH